MSLETSHRAAQMRQGTRRLAQSDSASAGGITLYLCVLLAELTPTDRAREIDVKIIGEFHALMCKRDRTVRSQRERTAFGQPTKGAALRQRGHPFHEPTRGGRAGQNHLSFTEG